MVVVKSTKKILGSKFGPKGPKSGQKLGFLPVSQVWFISCLEIAYNDSLQQCITSSRGKTHETDFWGTKFGLKLARIWPEIRFCLFLKFVSLVFLEIEYNDSFQQCLISSEVKSHKENF